MFIHTYAGGGFCVEVYGGSGSPCLGGIPFPIPIPIASTGTTAPITLTLNILANCAMINVGNIQTCSNN